MGQLRQAIAPSLYPVTVDWGLDAEGENCQVPRVVPAIFHGSRLSLFRIFAGDVKVGRKVVLKAGNTEQELEMDKEPRLSGELLHKMFARRMIQELEEEPHLGDSERDLIKDMSLKYNIMSSFTSFIAVDERSEKKEGVWEMLVRRVDNMIPHGFGGISKQPLDKYKNKKWYFVGDGCSFVPEKSHVEKAEEAVCERRNKLCEVEEKTESMTNDGKVSYI